MPDESAKAADAAAWFRLSWNDLAAADHALGAGPSLHTDSVFHAQQAAEKAMKGFLTWHDRRFRKTHNLVELGEQCVAIDSGLEPVLREAAPSRNMPGDSAIPVPPRN